MVKAMGVLVGVFGVGAAVAVSLGPLLGAHAEQTALALVGLALVISSQVLGAKLAGVSSARPPIGRTLDAQPERRVLGR